MLDDKLREEIIDSQKAQNDLAKWKLIMVAAVGAAGLGAGLGNWKLEMIVVWALIPCVCLYTDTVSYHAGIRIVTIARYFRLRQETHGYQALIQTLDAGDLAAMRLFDHYEWFCKKHRHQFLLEGLAVNAVSVLLSGIVLLIGADVLSRTTLELPERDRVLVGTCLLVFGACGFVGAVISYEVHRRRTAWLDHALLTDDRPRLFELFFRWKPPVGDATDFRELPIHRSEPALDRSLQDLAAIKSAIDDLTARLVTPMVSTADSRKPSQQIVPDEAGTPASPKHVEVKGEEPKSGA
ncbi:MAG: uncharacterized protein JWO56_3559 [Acidobacteria bacterium]|nr:uncharacterized protein [Acidobacteriota bacterium]